jgi:hypothetical protein
VPYSEYFPKPKAMTEEQMKVIENAFVAAVERCEKIGCMSLFSRFDFSISNLDFIFQSTS